MEEQSYILHGNNTEITTYKVYRES